MKARREHQERTPSGNALQVPREPVDTLASGRPARREVSFDSPSSLRVLQIVLVAALAFAVYSNTLSNGFVNDDEDQVLSNPWIKSVRFIPDMFSKSVWGFMPAADVSNYYRPLMHVIYLVNYHLFGYQPWGFHLINVLFHVANTAMVFLLTARLAGVDEAAGIQDDHRVIGRLFSAPFVAALLFATHPVHTEAVAWIASIPELSFTLLYLLSFYLYVTPAGAVRRLLSVACFSAALLCKETALTLPALLVVYDVACKRNQRTTETLFARYAPYVAVAALYFILRRSILLHTFARATWLQDLSSYQLVLSAFALFRDYVEQLLLPIHLNFRHPFHPVLSLLNIEGAVSLALVVACGAAALLSWKKNHLSFLCLSLFVIPLTPAFYIQALQGKPFAERYLYLPSIGFVILVAMLLRRVSTVKQASIATTLAIVATTAAYSTATISRNRVWRDAYTLFSDTVTKNPDTPIPPYDLAVALFNQGHIDEAMAQYRILVRVKPDDGRYQSALGSALLGKGKLDEAIEHLKIALSLTPDSLESHNDLGIALRRKGDVAGAIAQYRKALTINPEYPDAHFNLGNALADTGQMDEAMEHYRTAVRLGPDNAYNRNVLGIECGKLGRLEEAVEQFQEAVRLAPSEPAYRRNLDRALALKQSATEPTETAK